MDRRVGVLHLLFTFDTVNNENMDNQLPSYAELTNFTLPDIDENAPFPKFKEYLLRIDAVAANENNGRRISR